jgi:hypothetical protein
MRNTKLIVLAGVSLSVLGSQALAQQSGGFTPQQLDEMSKQRMQELGPRNWGPPPPQSSVPPQNLHQPGGLVVCMSIKQWSPIYAKPNASSQVVGKTLPQVAVTGATVNGFVPILMGRGGKGYVPAGEVTPFRSTIKAGLTCNVELRADGSAVYDIH